MNHLDHRGKLSVDWLLSKLCAKLTNACMVFSRGCTGGEQEFRAGTYSEKQAQNLLQTDLCRKTPLFSELIFSINKLKIFQSSLKIRL